MKNKTKERIENFLEMLINEIEENGMMQYDNMKETILENAKELCIRIKQEQKTEDNRVDCLCNALNKIMDIEMEIAMEYRVNVEDSEIYNTAHDAIQKANPEYFSTNNK